jgi:Amt family ammonium transporter
VLAAALFMSKDFDYRVAVDGATDKGGLFTEGNASPLGAAAAEIAAVVVWTGSISSIMFMILKKLGLLRVSAEVEAVGMDVSKHGGSAYPESQTVVRSDLAA